VGHALVDAIAGWDLSSSKAPATFPHVEDGGQLATAVPPWLARHAV